MHHPPKTPTQTADDFFDDFTTASSATDCTGLIQIPPQNEAEHDSYMDVYQYQPPKPVQK